MGPEEIARMITEDPDVINYFANDIIQILTSHIQSKGIKIIKVEPHFGNLGDIKACITIDSNDPRFIQFNIFIRKGSSVIDVRGLPEGGNSNYKIDLADPDSFNKLDWIISPPE